MDEESTGIPAGTLRRLAALLYDVLLTVALLVVATFATLPLTGGEAITRATHGAWEYAYRAWLLLVAFGYFGLSWTRGRTLGLAAWRLCLVAADGAAPGWRAALLRFTIGSALACSAGLGIWWMARPPASGRAAAVLLLLPLVVNYAWLAFAGRRSLMDRLGGMRVLRR